MSLDGPPAKDLDAVVMFRVPGVISVERTPWDASRRCNCRRRACMGWARGHGGKRERCWCYCHRCKVAKCENREAKVYRRLCREHGGRNG